MGAVFVNVAAVFFKFYLQEKEELGQVCLEFLDLSSGHNMTVAQIILACYSEQKGIAASTKTAEGKLGSASRLLESWSPFAV